MVVAVVAAGFFGGVTVLLLGVTVKSSGDSNVRSFEICCGVAATVVVVVVEGSITMAIPSNRTRTTSDTVDFVDDEGGFSGGGFVSMAVVTFEAVRILYFKALQAKDDVEEVPEVLVANSSTSSSSSTNRISMCIVWMVQLTTWTT